MQVYYIDIDIGQIQVYTNVYETIYDKITTKRVCINYYLFKYKMACRFYGTYYKMMCVYRKIDFSEINFNQMLQHKTLFN